MEQGFYYIIPAKLVEGGDHIKALLYGLISSLCNAEGFCWASNEYLAKKLGRKSKNVISEAISALENEGWIKSSVDRAKGNKRKIVLTAAYPMVEYRATSPEITGEGYSVKTGDSIISKSIIKESNTATEVAEVMDIFKKSVNPTISFGHKTYRKASEELIKVHGFDLVVRAAKFAVSIHGQQYAPVIGNPYQLKIKWAELVAFGKRAKTPRVGYIANE